MKHTMVLFLFVLTALIQRALCLIQMKQESGPFLVSSALILIRITMFEIK